MCISDAFLQVLYLIYLTSGKRFVMSHLLTLSTQSMYNGLFHALFWFEPSRSAGMKGLIHFLV